METWLVSALLNSFSQLMRTGLEVVARWYNQSALSICFIPDLTLDLSSLPFGTLRKAQQALAKAKTIADSEDDADSEEVSDHEPEEIPTSTRTTKGKERQKTEITKRKNKHA